MTPNHHNEFLRRYENDSSVTIFYHQDHERCRKNVFKSHHRLVPEPTRPFSAPLVAPPIEPPPTWLLIIITLPILQRWLIRDPSLEFFHSEAIHQISDLNHYWTVINGQTMTPLITTIEIDGNVPPPFGTDPGADDENAIDIELTGGMCVNAQINFYSAANSGQGFYDAFNQAIVDGVHVLSCSWGYVQEEDFGDFGYLPVFDALFQLGIANGMTIAATSGEYSSSDGNRTSFAATNPLPVPIPHVDYPGCSPYVVSCGGTSLVGSHRNRLVV